ncbi:MAG: TauD/TfdA family dioxygenase [Acidobacteriota bacterium]
MTQKPSLAGLGSIRPRTVTVDSELTVRRSTLPGLAELPLLIEPERTGGDFAAWARGQRATFDRELATAGGILFRGFHIDGPEGFQRAVEALGGEALEYKERSSPRSEVSGRVYTSTDYPPDQPIFLHNENSYAHRWPARIFFFCDIEPDEGGATPLADVRRVYDRIPEEMRRRFEERGILYRRNFSDLVGLSWQTVFQTDSREEAEGYATAAGYRIEWLAGDRLRTERRAPAVVRHPGTDEPIWFNHGTFFHLSTLPDAVREGLEALFPREELPNHTYYGDGSEIEAETMAALRQAYRDETISFPWRRGDLLMLDNMLVAHGREPFRGERRILTAMTEPIEAAELPETAP